MDPQQDWMNVSGAAPGQVSAGGPWPGSYTQALRMDIPYHLRGEWIAAVAEGKGNEWLAQFKGGPAYHPTFDPNDPASVATWQALMGYHTPPPSGAGPGPGAGAGAEPPPVPDGPIGRGASVNADNRFGIRMGRRGQETLAALDAGAGLDDLDPVRGRNGRVKDWFKELRAAYQAPPAAGGGAADAGDGTPANGKGPLVGPARGGGRGGRRAAGGRGGGGGGRVAKRQPLTTPNATGTGTGKTGYAGGAVRPVKGGGKKAGPGKPAKRGPAAGGGRVAARPARAAATTRKKK